MALDMDKTKKGAAVTAGIGLLVAGIYAKNMFETSAVDQNRSTYGALVTIHCLNQNEENTKVTKIFPGETANLPVIDEQLDSNEREKVVDMQESINDPETRKDPYFIKLRNQVIADPFDKSNPAGTSVISWTPASEWDGPNFNLTELMNKARKQCNEDPEPNKE